MITPSEPPKANKLDVESTLEMYTGDGNLKFLITEPLLRSKFLIIEIVISSLNRTHQGDC